MEPEHYTIIVYTDIQDLTSALIGVSLPLEGSVCTCTNAVLAELIRVLTSVRVPCWDSISPRNSRWAELKVKAPRYIGLSSMLCWILTMLINTISPIYVTSKWINTSITKRKDYGYCNAVFQDTFTGSLFLALLLLPDAVSLGLMLLASSYMVFILHRHKQQVQHIHGPRNASPRTSPESRATRSILALVSTFVFFYMVSSTFQVYLALLSKPSQLTVNISALFAGCFPTLSPYLLMSCDSRVPRLFFASIRNTKSPNIIRNMYLVFAL
nr:vomeronasal type-1 receptor 4-like [Oryctolagus cuniculus]